MKTTLTALTLLSPLIAAQVANSATIASVTRLDGGDLNPAVSEIVNAASLRPGFHYYANANTNFTYGTLPTYLMDADYIQTDIGDIAKADYQLSVTLATQAKVFLFIDDRVSQPMASMPWLAQLGFTDIGINNLTVGNNLPYSIYSSTLPAGTIVLGANGSQTTGNMYTIAAIPVPEPSAASFMAAAFALCTRVRRRRTSR
ncbi:hypothetical protein [Luteolibacter soli]|uniref:PEP-CTERM protein-sorting domain-containing protein n=1 Tax=Luteolibacter soli TaxID=3135280 RepID=A0ABU9AYI3_9BACT